MLAISIKLAYIANLTMCFFDRASAFVVDHSKIFLASGLITATLKDARNFHQIGIYSQFNNVFLIARQHSLSTIQKFSSHLV